MCLCVCVCVRERERERMGKWENKTQVGKIETAYKHKERKIIDSLVQTGKR